MASAYVPGIRERKKRETRNRLAKAAVDIITEQGLDAATIAAISERADVSSRTFHNYFAHRDAAIMHFLEYMVDRSIEYIEAQPKGLHPIDVMRNVRESFFTEEDSTDIESTLAQVESLLVNVRGSQLVDVQKECFQLITRLAQAISDYSEGKQDLFEAYVFLNASIVTSKSARAIQYFAGTDVDISKFVCDDEDPEDKAFAILRSGFTSC